MPFVLVINCGSSSIKLALVEPSSGECPWQALAERLGTAEARLVLKPSGEASRTLELKGADHEAALEAALGALPALPIAAVGHRVVHGGEAFAQSSLLTDDAIHTIESCSDLAPLHNPANLAGIRAMLRRRPDLKQVAVFDTAFHQTMPPHAYLYALPYELYTQRRIRRYGFHGTSHVYVAERAAELLGRPLEQLNLITAHLGNGASATAIRAGRSVDTTMGLTPLEGLVMGTRSGDVDPGLHEYLIEHAGMTIEQVGELLNKRSGLLGVSGESNDMRNLLELEAKGHARAQLAIEIFCYRLAKGVLALCAALPSLDAIVFTGGIGENAGSVRERTLRSLAVLGDVRVLVVPTNEELMIAREAVRIVQS